MLPELSEIKTKRKHLGFSQSELALKTGVSQSLIAKIEAAKIVPTYSKAKKIFDFFEQIHQKQQLKAKELMTQPVKCIQFTAKIKDAIKMMEKNGISQLPVLENEVPVGTISENAIVNKMQEAKDLQEFKDLKVLEIMEEALPTVMPDTPFSVVSAMLEHGNAVLVLKQGKIRGIISKSNLLTSLVKERK